ncbi:MAG: hypothetical protein PWQ57_1043 [Desulfovibrionales bacterium]|nr:hypothetical protein [Desulfovibrionales bacterium]
MALSKKYLKSKPMCKVGFSVPAEAVQGAKKVFLVGEFNDWSETARPMRKQKDGSYSITQDLAVGRQYQFRYLTDAGQWINDDAADDYAVNDFGADNSVVEV